MYSNRYMIHMHPAHLRPFRSYRRRVHCSKAIEHVMLQDPLQFSHHGAAEFAVHCFHGGSITTLSRHLKKVRNAFSGSLCLCRRTTLFASDPPPFWVISCSASVFSVSRSRLCPFPCMLEKGMLDLAFQIVDIYLWRIGFVEYN